MNTCIVCVCTVYTHKLVTVLKNKHALTNTARCINIGKYYLHESGRENTVCVCVCIYI